MTKTDKLKQKFANCGKTFIFSELVTLLNQLGYTMHERAGSRVVFIHDNDNSDRIHLHKPHPENTIKGGALKAVKAYLTEKGLLETETQENDHDNDAL